jgi:hypothetical protein
MAFGAVSLGSVYGGDRPTAHRVLSVRDRLEVVWIPARAACASTSCYVVYLPVNLDLAAEYSIRNLVHAPYLPVPPDQPNSRLDSLIRPSVGIRYQARLSGATVGPQRLR